MSKNSVEYCPKILISPQIRKGGLNVYVLCLDVLVIVKKESKLTKFDGKGFH